MSILGLRKLWTALFWYIVRATQEENKEEGKDKEKESGKEDISTESEDEGKANGEVKKKGNFGPRKKFEWNQEIR